MATTSVSVSETKLHPSASSRRLSVRKFSMMPLWMRATRPRLSRMGWALRSEGAPWVAQRVWPRPKLPSTGSASSLATSRPSFPSAFTVASSPSRTTTTPAES